LWYQRKVNFIKFTPSGSKRIQAESKLFVACECPSKGILIYKTVYNVLNKKPHTFIHKSNKNVAQKTTKVWFSVSQTTQFCFYFTFKMTLFMIFNSEISESEIWIWDETQLWFLGVIKIQNLVVEKNAFYPSTDRKTPTQLVLVPHTTL
jgi:hypothetical protein